MSAAHCFAENSEDYIPKEKLRIVYGLHDLKLLEESFVEKTIRNIDEVIVHPRYKYPEAYADVVILKVDKTVKFSDVIYPVCLPDKQNKNKNHLNEKSVSVVGFGPSEDGSNILRKISQTVRSYSYCNGRHKPKNVDIKLRPLLSKELPNGFDGTLICSQNK